MQMWEAVRAQSQCFELTRCFEASSESKPAPAWEVLRRPSYGPHRVWKEEFWPSWAGRHLRGNIEALAKEPMWENPEPVWRGRSRSVWNEVWLPVLSLTKPCCEGLSSARGGQISLSDSRGEVSVGLSETLRAWRGQARTINESSGLGIKPSIWRQPLLSFGSQWPLRDTETLGQNF